MKDKSRETNKCVAQNVKDISAQEGHDLQFKGGNQLKFSSFQLVSLFLLFTLYLLKKFETGKTFSFHISSPVIVDFFLRYTAGL